MSTFRLLAHRLGCLLILTLLVSGCAATASAIARLLMELGNISANSTQVTGPHDSANPLYPIFFGLSYP